MTNTEQAYGKWRSKYMKTYKNGLYVYYKEKSEGSSAMTCSEAHGYGMLIAVLKRNKQDFDGLYRYFQSWKNKRGLMQWQQKSSGNGTFVPGDEGGENSATDGDIDITTALFLAAKVWGKGEIDYRAAATSLASNLWKYCFNHDTFLPLVGDWASAGDSAHVLTRPSDFILSGFLTFYNEDKARQEIWAKVISAVIKTYQAQLALHPDTGLVADFLTLDSKTKTYKPVTKQVLESKHDPDYNWNSCRVPWRLAHYFKLSKDEKVRPLLEAEAKFFGDVLTRGRNDTECPIRAGYYLNGKSYVNYSDKAFNAPVSFLFRTLGQTQQLQQIMKYINKDTESSYYGDTIAMLGYLQAENSRFRILFSAYTLLVAADNSLITVNNPVANQVLTPGQQVIVQYTVNGIPPNGKPVTQEIPNYPNSMDVIFRWTGKNSISNEFIALNGLNTDPYPGSLKNQVYSHRWKLPNCHFFRRYQPSEWTFAMIFQTQYSESLPVPVNHHNATKKIVVVPLGPKQSNITLPLSVVFNATLMADPHHKGC
ncbi:Six-hairpin glycosidase-like protein [Mucor mucedo]|uniref:Six-hairpin glycosidase-like protein n=1 Tax=Mucor mucedo TaxID=29922 RepID=UPI00221E9878|nr:Six-hairpin glycosidase-like protein [Mucor mucedo]KAI7895666.1 Six-hairpin glycosidase-like protein [Mucor mucedo]